MVSNNPSPIDLLIVTKTLKSEKGRHVVVCFFFYRKIIE